MAIRLTGNLQTITSSPIDQVADVRIKKPTPELGADSITTTQPEKLTVDAKGNFVVDVVAGVGWLYINGDGWSDSIRFVAAAGMTKFWEAVINAIPLPVPVLEYLSLKDEMKRIVDKAVADVPTAVRWNKGRITPATTPDYRGAPTGYTEIWNATDARTYGLPVSTAGVLETFRVGNITQQRYTGYESGKLHVWQTQYQTGQEPVWERLQWVNDRVSTYPVDEIPDGITTIWNTADCKRIGLDVSGHGTLETISYGTVKLQRAVVLSGGKFHVLRRGFEGGQWLAWEDTRAGWVKNRVSTYPVDEIPDGITTIWNTADCDLLGIPAAGHGTLETVSYGNVKIQKATILTGGEFKVFRRGFEGGQWLAWEGRNSGPTPTTDSATTGRISAAPPASLKTVPLALSLGNVPGSKRAAAGSYRNKFLYNAPILRWRVCMSARNPRIGTTKGSDVTVTRVTFGCHAGGGKFTNAPRTVATNLKLSRDGAVAYGPWQTDGIEQNVEHLLGYDYTATGEVAGLVGSCWKTTSGTAADVAPALTTDWQTPLDIWIEAETYAGTPVVAAFGDSLTCGVGNTWSVFDSWLSQYCRAHEALPVHYAASGDTAQSWAEDTGAYKWTRWDRHPAPDAVIWALGSNDLGTGRSLEELVADTLAGVAEVRRKFPSPLFVTNITPRDKWLVEGSDARRKQYNDWLLTQGWHRGVFDFSSVILDPATGGIKAELNGDGVHFNTAGFAAEAAAITPPVTAPPVVYRQ